MLATLAKIPHSQDSILETRCLKLATSAPDGPKMSECLIDVIVDRFLDTMDGIRLLMRQVPSQGSHSRLSQGSPNAQPQTLHSHQQEALFCIRPKAHQEKPNDEENGSLDSTCGCYKCETF